MTIHRTGDQPDRPRRLYSLEEVAAEAGIDLDELERHEHRRALRARAVTTVLGATAAATMVAATWWPSWLLWLAAVTLVAVTVWRVSDPGGTR